MPIWLTGSAFRRSKARWAARSSEGSFPEPPRTPHVLHLRLRPAIRPSTSPFTPVSPAFGWASVHRTFQTGQSIALALRYGAPSLLFRGQDGMLRAVGHRCCPVISSYTACQASRQTAPVQNLAPPSSQSPNQTAAEGLIYSWLPREDEAVRPRRSPCVPLPRLSAEEV